MAIESPCLNICLIDPVSGLCIGCGRTGAEVAAWIGMTDTERRVVMAELPDRLVRMRSRDVRGRRRSLSRSGAPCSPDA